MPDGRRLPTSVFGFLAVVILSVGGGWWVHAAPPAPAPLPPPSPAAAADTYPGWPLRRVVAEPQPDGTVRTYVVERGRSRWRQRGGEAVSTPTWPCRVSRSTAYPQIGSASGARVAQSLRCVRQNTAR
ncbi:hypothetical protein [Jidongwangia harbinensis]|uniref:hypothetical protein n=1 Tax=Jidongwangia harbinensis TaxID=2878561 RepID=UPI001CD9FB2D|nr:hypothetical protein [Jidongwangia harbinensis]MCA2212894.1 hypothetical protein [Jidongwangia harbinensis]